MPTERISVNSSFGLLDDGKSRWGSLATSMVTNVTILILLLIIGAIHHQVVVKKMQADALLFPVEPPKPPKVEVPKVKVVAPPQPPKLEIAKVEPPEDSAAQAGDRAAQAGKAGRAEAAPEHSSCASEGRCASTGAEGRHVRQQQTDACSEQPEPSPGNHRRFR